MLISRSPFYQNEYAKQIKELQAQENSGKGYAKVFVKGSFDSISYQLMAELKIGAVLGIKNLTVPIPQQPTASTCTLNNGIHFVTTPEYRLGRESRIDQEFELYVAFAVRTFAVTDPRLGLSIVN